MTAAAAHAALAALRAEADACRRLWCAVVARVMLDANRVDHDGDDARRWLRRPDPLVLALLDLDAEAVAPVLGRLAEQGSRR